MSYKTTWPKVVAALLPALIVTVLLVVLVTNRTVEEFVITADAPDGKWVEVTEKDDSPPKHWWWLGEKRGMYLVQHQDGHFTYADRDTLRRISGYDK